jgi:hydrogenase nickel incorporation protein HypB
MELVIVSGDVRARQDEAWLGRHRPRVVHPVLTEPAWLDAHHIERALDLVDVDGTELLLIERTGDFVFGASTDLGEDARVVLLPVTDGDDKPLKYPTPYREARHLVITKMDLLAFVPFNLRRAVGYARDANPDIDILYTSALTGEGMDEWYDLLRAVVRRRAKRLVEFA